MKAYNSTSIKEALYNTFAHRLGPDGWEKLESEFWDELETAQMQSSQPAQAEPSLGTWWYCKKCGTFHYDICHNDIERV